MTSIGRTTFSATELLFLSTVLESDVRLAWTPLRAAQAPFSLVRMALQAVTTVHPTPHKSSLWLQHAAALPATMHATLLLHSVTKANPSREEKFPVKGSRRTIGSSTQNIWGGHLPRDHPYLVIQMDTAGLGHEVSTSSQTNWQKEVWGN